MKLTFEDFITIKKTRSEKSLACDDIWISRSAIEIKTDAKIIPIFGFGAARCQAESETSSIYELLEHLVFLSYLHDNSSLKNPVSFYTNSAKDSPTNHIVEQYLLGSTGPRGIFSANGSSVYKSIQGAVLHSKRELLERHLCCEAWYNRSLSLHTCLECTNWKTIPSVKLRLFTAEVGIEGKFAIASLECHEENFFVLGAAVKSDIIKASEHAACEALMLYNDAKRKRTIGNSTESSRLNMLSLRDENMSAQRKDYFLSLISSSSKSRKLSPPLPECKTIFFEPLPNIYAARSFSSNALDPREFSASDNIPLMPLF